MTGPGLTLTVVPGSFAICRLDGGEVFPGWARSGAFVSVTRTDDELSVVCPEGNVPADVIHEGGRTCLKVEGPLDLSMTGVLSSLTGPLSAAGVSVFAVSTYDTDYLLVRVEDLELVISVLTAQGHTFRR